MDSNPFRSGLFLGRVVRNKSLCRDHFEITLGLDRFPPAQPGQFLQIACSSAPADAASPLGPLLRRPFSIAGLRRSATAVELDIIGRVIGPGTQWLSSRCPGDEIDILGPLGTPFSMPKSGRTVVLVAGGVGLPPIRWWAEILRKHGVSCVAVVGAQCRDLLPLDLLEEPSPTGQMTLCAREFARDAIPACITTDDGSCGLPGRVTDALEVYFSSLTASTSAHLYMCGPEAMLRAIALFCHQRRIECQAALERVMGCGMATCQSCVVPVFDETREDGRRYALCCRDGPVFDAARVIW